MGVKRDTLVRMLADPLISQELNFVLFSPNAPPTCHAPKCSHCGSWSLSSEEMCLGNERNETIRRFS
jgi:hypothetical protein